MKNNIKFLVIQKNGEEEELTFETILNIEKESERYSIISVKPLKYYYEYMKIFNVLQCNKNIFSLIVGSMKNWFFELSMYAISIDMEYIRKGKFNPIKKKLFNLKIHFEVHI